jgi:hypothetical protein
MKLLIIVFSILNCSTLFSQKKFHIESQVETQTILVNGKKYRIDNIGTKISTRFPNFDTLVFQTESANSKMQLVCNFKPDSSYVITYACCGSLDIIPKSKFNCDSLKYWTVENDFGEIQNNFLDKPYLSIRTKKAPKDSVYAWHADAACITQHQLIGTDLWKLGVPPKCFYWSNITAILFFKTDAKSNQNRSQYVEEFLDKKNVIELATIHLRLFDNQKFILTFDEDNNTVKLTYE